MVEEESYGMAQGWALYVGVVKPPTVFWVDLEDDFWLQPCNWKLELTGEYERWWNWEGWFIYFFNTILLFCFQSKLLACGGFCTIAVLLWDPIGHALSQPLHISFFQTDLTNFYYILLMMRTKHDQEAILEEKSHNNLDSIECIIVII